MRGIFLWAMVLATSFRTANAQSDSIQRQINQQVWKPFIQSFNARDNEGFKAVHSKEVSRVLQDEKRILNAEEYFKPVPDSIKARWAAYKSNLELRFTQRIATGDRAFEVGYYKSSSTNTNTGQTRTSYGKFHVLLRKENGVWKILMDADARENADEKTFMSAAAME